MDSEPIVAISRGRLRLTSDRTLGIESLACHPGDNVFLVGGNGAGKSSLLDVLAGYRKLDSGSIVWSDRSSGIGYAVQDSAGGLLPWKNVLANILLPAKLAGQAALLTARAEALLHEFALAQYRTSFPYMLSGGEKQLINLIRTLCTPGHLYLFDEVLASLHEDMRRTALDAICQYVTTPSTCTVSVTHDARVMSVGTARFVLVRNDEVCEVSSSEASRSLQ